jgi:GalNAc-alpha-(1->4)-GalNAc-alpha-(1->3)-diNAcBac-PP-undecaprenol alpha-1,4-N-acetyl-D-galactosaminyltransferase
MKICLTNAALHCGGAERALSEFANYLVDQGDDVTVLLIFKKEIFYKLDSRVKIVEPTFERAGTNKVIYAFKTIKFLRQSIRQIDPEVILNFIFPSFFLIATIGIGVPIYISVRNDPSKTSFIDPGWIRRILFKRSPGIIAQTSFAKDTLTEQVAHKNIKVIPNYVRQIRQTDELPSKKIVSVGRLIQSKGHDHLIEAFAGIDDASWELIIAGDGPLRKQLQGLAANLGVESRVHFLGSQPDIDKVLQSCEIFAFCSLSEGFPNALLEAMATPLACISYNCQAGPSDIITDGQNGFLVAVGDKDEFKRKLYQLVKDTNLRETFKASAIHTRKRFDATTLANAYRDFINGSSNRGR